MKKTRHAVEPPLPETLKNLPPGLAPGEYAVRPDGTVVPKAFVPSKPLKRYKRDPLENHPRAAETRELMREARFDDEVEVMDLQASELACDVADAWVRWRNSDALEKAEAMGKALSRLELVTRPSAMRKVRP